MCSVILFRIISLAIFFQAIAIQSSWADEPIRATTLEKFTIPGHGQLLLQVPVNWEFTYILATEDQPPIITFYELDSDKKEIFQMNVSSLWDDGFRRNITDHEHVRTFVESIGNKLLAASSETELMLIPIKGESGSGYYFSLSDATAKQEEYQYLTQGAYAMNDILLVFSLFTHGKDPQLHDAGLTLINTASQVLQNIVYHADTTMFTPVHLYTRRQMIN